MYDQLFVAASTHATTPTLKIAGRVQIEAATLATRRAQAYLEIPATLARCQTAQDLFTAQVMFWQLAQRHYAEGLDHLATSIQSSNLGHVGAARTIVQPIVPPARVPDAADEATPATPFASSKRQAPSAQSSSTQTPPQRLRRTG
jgi:hypothetical protein